MHRRQEHDERTACRLLLECGIQLWCCTLNLVHSLPVPGTVMYKPAPCGVFDDVPPSGPISTLSRGYWTHGDCCVLFLYQKSGRTIIRADHMTVGTKHQLVRWNTRLTKMMGCNVPIVGAPMAGHSGGALAAAVCRAGGLGFIGVGHWLASESGLQRLEQEVSLFRKHHACSEEQHPLSLGFIGYSTFRDSKGWDRFQQVLEKYQPKCVQFFAPSVVMDDDKNGSATRNNIRMVHEHSKDTVVFAQVGTVQEALVAVEAGADVIIAQGSEAGGHGVRRSMGNGTLSLVRTLVKRLPAVPIVAAGGIVDGPTMAAALVLGCDGVVLGTRLWASEESTGKQSFKDRLVATSSCDDVTRTSTFDWIQNTYSPTPWPEPYDSVGGIRNVTSKTWDDRPDELIAALQKESIDSSTNPSGIATKYRQATIDGDADVALVHAGEGVGLVDAIEPAETLVRRIAADCATTIANSTMIVE